MGWQVGFDPDRHRDIGYGVPAWCDAPRCPRLIDRGLAYVCGDAPYGGEHGCGLHFCDEHLSAAAHLCARCARLCARCAAGETPYDARPDHPTWIRFKLSDHSWEQWRTEHPDSVEAMRAHLVKVDG